MQEGYLHGIPSIFGQSYCMHRGVLLTEEGAFIRFLRFGTSNIQVGTGVKVLRLLGRCFTKQLLAVKGGR